MPQRLNVLFVVAQPATSPAITVHANLMRFLDRDRVGVHAVYNRLAASEPFASSGRSVLDVLPHDPDIPLIASEFGPVGGAPKAQLLRDAAAAGWPMLAASAQLVRYIRRHRIDVVYCEEGLRNSFYGLLLARAAGVKSVSHFHSKYGDWMTPPSRFGVAHADLIITVSAWTGSVIEAAGVAPERIVTVLNGIDLARWDPAADGSVVRRELAMEDGAPLIVCVAQLTHYKRQALLIDAFEMVAAQHPDARLLLVGQEWNPPGSGESYAEQLRRQVARARLGERVIFAGQRGDIPQVLAAADIVSLPSVDDPCPLAHIEAMAMGRPIVSVRAGGTPEIVEHDRTGLLSTPDAPDELAANLLTLINSPERRRELGRQARRRAEDRLSVQHMAEGVERELRRLVGAGAALPSA